MILSLCTQRCYGRHNISRKYVNINGYSILLHGVISLPDATSCNKVLQYRDQPRIIIETKFVKPIALMRHTKTKDDWLISRDEDF